MIEKWLIASVGLMSVAGAACPQTRPAPVGTGEIHTVSLFSGGWERQYALYLPSGYTPDKPLPVVLFFHGAGGGGAESLERDRWIETAERETFAAVAPVGLPALPRLEASFRRNPRLWNDGQLRPASPRAAIDDVAFAAAVLDDLERQFNVDRSRIYATGHSNGAGMTFRLGADLSERFAAIAPVAGHCWIEKPRPVRKLPTLYILGEADPLVSIEGGEITLPWGTKTNPPVAQTIVRWVGALDVASEPRKVSNTAGMRVDVYGDEEADAAMKVLIISGQGHGWPGGLPRVCPRPGSAPAWTHSTPPPRSGDSSAKTRRTSRTEPGLHDTVRRSRWRRCPSV